MEIELSPRDRDFQENLDTDPFLSNKKENRSKNHSHLDKLRENGPTPVSNNLVIKSREGQKRPKPNQIDTEIKVHDNTNPESEFGPTPTMTRETVSQFG